MITRLQLRAGGVLSLRGRPDVGADPPGLGSGDLALAAPLSSNKFPLRLGVGSFLGLAEEFLKVLALGVEGSLVGQLAVVFFGSLFRTVTLFNTEVLGFIFPRNDNANLAAIFLFH